MPALLLRSRNTFWLVPAACVVVALALALVVPRPEGLIPSALLFPGGPGGARSVLGSITTSMISITGVVFSITVVALQLAASPASTTSRSPSASPRSSSGSPAGPAR